MNWKQMVNIELFLTAVFRFGGIGVGILLFRYFSTQNALEDWGAYTLVLAYSSVVVLFTQFGQGTFLLKQQVMKRGQMFQIQVNSLVLAIIPMSVGLLLRPWIAETLFFALIMAPVFVWYRNFCFFYQRIDQSRVMFSLLNQNMYLSYTLFAVVLILMWTTIPMHWYVPIAFGGLAIGPLLYYFVNLPTKYRELSRTQGTTILRQSFPFFTASVSGILLGWMDTIMLGHYTDTETVALYNGIFKISSLITVALGLMNSYVAPRIRAAFEEGGGSLERLIQPFSRLGLLISVIAYAVLIWGGPFIFKLLGLSFTPALHQSLLVLAAGYVVNAAVGSVGFVLQLSGHPQVYNAMILLALIVNVILNIVLIPDHGLMGAAIASTVAMALWNVGCYMAVRIKLGFSTI